MTKILWLDAGHGGKDAGAVNGTLFEKNVVLDIVKRMKSYVESNYDGVKVMLTRNTDVFHELSVRTNMANKAKADYFMSVHVNAGGGTGYEDFIHDQLSATSTTAKMRDTVHAEVVKVLTKYGIKNRGKKKANFTVIAKTTMPAILVETLFIDTAKDKALIQNSAFIQDISEAYAIGAAKALGLKAKAKTVVPTPKPTPTPTKPSGDIYRVQVGAYGQKTNAEVMAKKLKAAGFEAIIVKN